MTRNGFATFIAFTRARSASPTTLSAALLALAISLTASIAVVAPASAQQSSLTFNGTNQYVTFGTAAPLGAASFTLECWVKRSAGGATTSTGTGGVTAFPLVTKGRGEAEASNVDCNYFMGIDAAGHLCADYEEGAGRVSPGLNHPVTATSVLATDVWYHVAATFDSTGGKWRLYVNGVLDGSLDVGAGRGPRFDSIQHAGLATAMTSTGVVGGFLAGVIDEARVWNVVRTPAQILASMNSELTSGAGLIGRWGLNEGTGTTAANSIVTSPLTPGTLTNTPAWTSATVFATPAAPGGLAATYVSATRNQLAWTDNSSNELSFEIERSTSGSAGPFTLLTTVGQNAASYTDNAAPAGPPSCYRVRAVDPGGASAYTGPSCGATVEGALDLGSASAYVNFGNPAALKLSQFTIEMWMRRDGAGTGANTGAGGIADAIPLVAKGMADGEVSSKDVNYLFGIQASTGLLCADFEEDTSGTSRSLNHPILGTTTIPADGVWRHVAVTYDGTWKLYLNGVLDAQLVVNRPPGFSSDVPVSLGRALILSGTPSGNFDGALDEVRIWNVARSQAQLLASANSQISTPTAGLVARWALDEGGGAVVNGSAGTALNGTITGTGYTWISPAPFNVAAASPPAAPGALAATSPTSTQVHLSWSDNSSDETGFELERSTAGSGGPFTLLAALSANTTSYDDNTVTPGSPYCYRVRAVNTGGGSSYAAVACATTPGPANTCLDFVGRDAAVNAYANLGNLAALHLSTFTVEAWIRRDSVGVGNTTGANGVDSAVPIMAKGMAEVETADADYNYFLGIQVSTGFLVADFEESQAGTTPGSNHPVYGTTPIPADSTWHHVAAAYDGTTWTLYLDGFLNGQLTVGEPVANVGISPASIGSALKTDGTPLGFFHGRIDEARVWDVARTQAQIQATINSELASATPGLVARWGLNEGTGTSVRESVGGVGGTIVNTFYSWQSGAPFNWTSSSTPADPTGLSVSACSQVHVDLSWTDNSGNETGFQVERGPASGGPFTLLATTAANTTSYSDLTVSPATAYCYRVRSVLGATPSNYAGPACVTTPATGNNALDLGGADAWVNFGNNSALSLATFTIEMWVRRDGAGTGTNTGAGGIADAVPLFAKGRAEVESAAADINYFVGIQQSTGVLCADFEEAQVAAGGTDPSLNHPVLGATSIPLGAWHHVAATYDGISMKLYLDGVLDASSDIGRPVNSVNTVAASLGSALTTTSLAAGFFDGAVDEVRVWNYAREQGQIQASANVQISSAQSGLVARWAMDEGAGATVGGSAGTSIAGAITGTYRWGCGTDAAPLNLDFPMPPLVPVLVSPADGGTGVPTSPSLSVAVADPNGDPVTVTWYGRPTTGTPGPDFTLVGFPDTQNYTSQAGTSSNAMFKAQMNWVVANRTSRNIVYGVHLGDCTEHGNNANNPVEWMRADTTMKILENPLTTGLADGFPYGLCVGNHDQSPIGTDLPDTTTRFYNQYFGTSRFAGRGYYGGHYGTNNDSWFDLFSASGMDFIVIGIEYEATADPAVLAWADQLLTTYASRRAIVASHFVVNTGNPGGFGPQGQAIYNALKGHSNLFLMLCGHVPGEGRRQDSWNGNTVNTLLSDYQSYANGGNGWMRYMEFSPANNVIRVRTYSPWLNQYEADADSSSQFTLPYVMSSLSPFTVLGSTTVPSGTTASFAWTGRAAGTPYEWYAEASDGTGLRTSPVWSFTTAAQVSYTITATAGSGGSIAPGGAVSVVQGAGQAFTIAPAVGYTIADVLVDNVSQGAIGSYSFSNVQANHSIASSFALIPLDLVAATVPLNTVISGAHPCVDVPVTFTRTSTTPARAYSVRVRLGGGLAACGAKFVKGTYLTSVAPSNFEVIDNLDGSYDVDEAILGATCGATGSGTLFTVRVGSSTPLGTGTISVENVLVRDCGNAPLPGNPGAAGSVAIDNTAPAAPTAVTAQRLTTGNDTNGTMKITLGFTVAVEPGGHVEVWRKNYGNYPEYDDGPAPGAVPSIPAAYPPAGWTPTAVTTSGETDEPSTRDSWYYVAYAVDAAGNASAPAMTAGALNYALGDVHDGSANCSGDNRVSTSDLTFFGAHYGAALSDSDPLACLDFGPTLTGYVDGRPLTDNGIDFEDLILFSINYSVVSMPSAASRPAARASGEGNSLRLSVEPQAVVGGTMVATLEFDGSGDVQALSAKLDYDPAVVEPVGVEGGALLSQQQGPARVFSPRPGVVDAAVFGRALGLAGSGQLARVTFRRKAAGETGIALGTLRARDQANHPVTLEQAVSQPLPARLELAPSYPNPFTHSTMVTFGVPGACAAKLLVFDIQGRAVRHLVDGVVGAGWQRVAWDGHDDAGNAVLPGAYVIRLSVDGRVISKSVRMVR